MPPLREGIVHEDGDKLYVVAPVHPLTPTSDDIEEYAFGRSIVDDLKQKAPNEHIAWYGGQYVEADRANLNGAMWLGGEIAIKSLTPMLMPVTVMHDPRSAVGLIADTRLHEPPAVPRSKIETALALWKHRFPEVVEEAEANYAQGTLMQSMECLAPNYSCSECGSEFHKLPDSAEREFWCEHLRASDPSGGFTAGQEVATAVRILRNVVFTGTGLIFGTQGGTGADPEAHLESFFGEIAEFHERAHHATSRPRSNSTVSETVAKTEFDRVVAERDALRTERDEAVAAAEKAKGDLEATETAKTEVEKERDEAKQKITNFEEKARRETLAEERIDALGKGFLAKLGEKTKGHLNEDAAAMSDEDWNKRLESVEELAGVKRDADEAGGSGEGGEAASAGSTFSREEVAGSAAGGAGGSNGAAGQSPAERRSVVSGLVPRPEKSKSGK